MSAAPADGTRKVRMRGPGYFFFLKVRHKLVFKNLSNQILVVTLFN